MPRKYFLNYFQFGCASVLLLFCSAGCTALFENSPSDSVAQAPAHELLLNTQAFPETWQADPCNLERCEREGTASRVFGRVGVPGHVIQSVYRFNTIQPAKVKFQLYSGIIFKALPPSQGLSTELVPPPEIKFTSSEADEFKFGCGLDTVPICRALFRYDNYVVEFFFDTDQDTNGVVDSAEGLSFEQVERVLLAMDEHSASVLQLQLPTNADKK